MALCDKSSRCSSLMRNSWTLAPKHTHTLILFDHLILTSCPFLMKPENVKKNQSHPISSTSSKTFKPGVPNLWDLMTGDLRWSCCNNYRNKVRRTCHVLELSPNLLLPTPTIHGELSSRKLVPGTKKVVDCCFKLKVVASGAG